MKKCIYCGKEIDDSSVIDFCEKCGAGVFGEKMLRTIIRNMENAREKGDLHQGIISMDTKEIDSDSNFGP